MGRRLQVREWWEQRAIRKRLIQAAVDDLAWVAALVLAELERRDLDPHRVHWTGLLAVLPIVFAAQAVAGRVSGLYRGRWIFGSFEEVAAVARTVAVAGIVLFGVDLLPFNRTRPVALGAVVGATLAAFLCQGGLRYAWRLVQERRFRMRATQRTRVIVFGAGAGGLQAIHAMLRDEDSPYLPVALIDDDPQKRSLSVMGVKVVGGRGAILDAASRYAADALLVAVPSADAMLVRELIDVALPLGLDVRVLPSVRELLGAHVRVVDIREPDERDLLGRHQIETDIDAISHYVTNRIVAVTGAGGSIGSELCRQIAALSPAELIMIDRDESALHAVQLSLDGRALLDSPNLVLLDIRDRTRVRRLFCERRPDVVFHAAALKHLPLLEAHPAEALKTNVWGTLSVLDASVAAGVGVFVNISTDKAANPTSVLGWSKRVAEGLTAWTAQETNRRFLSVRFGNVLGSRGSVLTAFRSQLASGGPLTVTHPDVTRFFMTVEEAVQLVVQAGAIGGPSEVLVLDMGEPVRIAEVASRLIGIAERPIAIEYTGLRPGEKLHEELFGDGEIARGSAHALISAVCAPPLDPSLVRDIDPSLPGFDAAACLRLLSEEMASRLLDPRGDDYSVPA